ncbi:hypothetical protein XA68_11615 [Ophiocordyceps unilateralis]|uniref:polynucleotide adenylyltransferase n=1 Tax=Ophiocordyceps unilateralis TaxID=268505 RepID=A0A2A9PNN1_OPHUN|nr:hypothetical protein XA68_11615 [Ophiocordyceps unilateralis]
MDGRASTSEPQQHSYHPTSWSAAASPPTASSATTSSTASFPVTPCDGSSSASSSDTLLTSPAAFPHHLDFIPLLFPQQSNIYQAQLLHYNKLVSPTRGGGLQAAPLPPAVSAHHVHAGTRSRSSSRVSLKEAKAAAAGGHGSRSHQSQDKSRPAMTTKDAPPKMSAERQQQVAESPRSVPKRSTAAPSFAAQGQSHSNSVPSTPHQHARQFSFESRDPSPTVPNSHSPRSAYSETNSTLPSLRPLPPRFGGCKFETAQMNSRRRIPYSVGNDRLERLDPRTVKAKLTEDEERKLAADMRELFDRLLPTEIVEANRRKLVTKLERIFNDEWPGHDIRAHLFGSSGNLLCSDDSDVDICITTPWQELEGVCMIAELLARRGMQKVVCISAAKVPIVKIWDPELGLACDMNVNNTLALENTRMVRTYVEADPRVRQLAMVIKYWTRRRIVNDAAFGGTLSSYTWICLIIAFLQLRSPPVLPALHQLPYKLAKPDGSTSDFADNLKKIKGFGNKNKSSVPDLLFQFFRFYAHEFDYDKHVLSVRQGKLVTKVDKKWTYQINNQLCVEEPFNVTRNLGNTADDYAFRGLHLELRRAFDLISEAKLTEACEQYVYPKEEERIFNRPAQQPRPALLRSSSQTQPSRGGRAGHRGGRHNGHFLRGGGAGGGGGGSNRRASSSVPSYDNGVFMAPMGVPQDVSWYQNPHFQFQYAQQDLMTQMAYHQENLRQLHLFTPTFLRHQALGQQQRVPAGSSGSGLQQQQQQQQPSAAAAAAAADRSRTNSFDNVPMSAPMRPDLYALYGMSIGAHAYYPAPACAGYGTYPSSPVAAAGTGPDFRRPLQRSTVTTDTGASASSSSLRSQSQPASRSPSAANPQAAAHQRGSQTPTGASFYAQTPTNAHGIPIPSFMPDDADFDETPKAASVSPEPEDGRSAALPRVRNSSPPTAVGRAPPHQPHGPSNAIAFGDLATASTAPGRRRLSTDQLPQTILDRRMKRASRSPSPLGHSRACSSATAPTGSQGKTSSRPLVVNGSGLRTSAVPGQHRAEARDRPEERPPNAASRANGGGGGGQTPTVPQWVEATLSPEVSTPVMVNGGDDASFRERIAVMASNHITPQGFLQDGPNGAASPSASSARLSPPARSWWTSRPSQGATNAPFDLETGDPRPGKASATESAHLSPVYETQATSPGAVRQNDGCWLSAKAVPEQGATAWETKAKAPTSRINGHVRGVKSESDGGWQKAGKGKKRANAQGEQAPGDDSERKGG